MHITAFSIMLLVIFLIYPVRAEKEGTRWAILVGINDYMKNVTPLKCAVNDAVETQRALLDTSDFNKENTILLSSAQRDMNLPTKVNIAKWISNVKTRIKPEDTFLFFFSGHGIQMDGEGYLLTFEADPYSEETLDASCLTISDIAKYFRKVKASRILICIDACRDDPRAGAATSRNGKDSEVLVSCSKGAEINKAKPEGSSNNPMKDSFSRSLLIPVPSEGTTGADCFSATFFSCDVGQRSYEWRENSMGFFTYFLVQGLRGGAADSGGVTTIKNLQSYIVANVSRAVKKEKRCIQTPRILFQREEAAQHWPVALRVLPITAAPATALLQGGTTPTLDVKPLPRSRKVKYTIDIIGNTVEGRRYDELTRQIEAYTCDVDKDTLFTGVAQALDGTGVMEATKEEKEADMWVFFNVCPTEEMTVDMLVRDCHTGQFISKQNMKFYRPYPGKKEQIAQSALKTLKDKFLANLVQSVKSRFYIDGSE